MDKPNILLITSDQQHFNTIGAFNHEIITPNLDRLVHEGTTFTRAYCPNPTCTPTRASIITGMYPSQHGAWTLGTKLNETEHTMCDDFNSNGYETALIGKAHFQQTKSTAEYPSLESMPLMQDLKFWQAFNGPFYGFKHIELARNHTNEYLVGQHYVLWLEEKGCTNWRDYFLPPTGNMNSSCRYNWDIPEEYHYNTWIAERTNKLLEQYSNSNQNFFLWASFFDPHPDYFAPKPWDTMYDDKELTVPSATEGEHTNNPPHFKLTQQDNADFSEYTESGFYNHGMHSHSNINKETARKNMSVYYGMVSLMDKYIGKILDKLDELNLTKNTIVVFTSDHGHFFGQHGLHAKGPFLYEDMIKVPFIVRYPDIVPSNKISDSMQSLIDLAPTFLDFCNIKIPNKMTGVSQKNVWSNKTLNVRDHIICEDHHEPTTIHLKTFVNKRYKLTVYYNHTYGELFDLQNDPNELNNLWDNENFKDLKMELLLKYIWAELGKEPIPMPRISGA